VVNDVESPGWLFQTFRQHDSFPKHQVTFTGRPSALPQMNGLFNYYLLQPPLFSFHSAVSQTEMKLFINTSKLRIFYK
jgi:hypothetical protein